MSQTEKGKPHRFPTTYNYKKVLIVLSPTEEKKTSVVKEDLSKEDPKYDKAHSIWYVRALTKLELEGLVNKIKKRRDNAYYWTITEDGTKARDAEKEK